MDPTTHIRAVTPAKILEQADAFARSMALRAAIELEICDALDEGLNTAQKLAQNTKTSVRGMEILLDALVAMELLTKRGETYSLTQESEHIWCRASQPIWANWWNSGYAMWWRWSIWPRAWQTASPGRNGECSTAASKITLPTWCLDSSSSTSRTHAKWRGNSSVGRLVTPRAFWTWAQVLACGASPWPSKTRWRRWSRWTQQMC